MQASEVVEMLKKDKKAMEELSGFIATEIALKPKFRNILIKTVAGELATKDDIEKLRGELKETGQRIKEDIKDYVDARISDLDKRLETQQKMMQIGFTVLGIMIAGFTLLVTMLFK